MNGVIKEFSGGSMAKTYLMQNNENFFVRKIVQNKDWELDGKKLFNQWKWMVDVKNDSNLKNIFPEVSFFLYDQQYSKYDMEFIEGVDLRNLFLIDEISFKDKRKVLEKMIYTGSLIARQKNKVNLNKNYIIDNHIQKMIKRCKDIVEKGFTKTNIIYINGKQYKNIFSIIKSISENDKMIDFLTPVNLYRSHGDFTFQNVIYAMNGNLKVIDPRGEGPDSLYYDISKIMQSCNGKYDLIYDDNFEVSLRFNNLDETEINYNIKKGVETYNKLYESVKEFIPIYYEVDKNWEIISKFYEGSHFISMIPFRFKESFEKMLICYAIGVKLLNEAMEEWENAN